MASQSDKKRPILASCYEYPSKTAIVHRRMINDLVFEYYQDQMAEEGIQPFMKPYMPVYVVERVVKKYEPGHDFMAMEILDMSYSWFTGDFAEAASMKYMKHMMEEDWRTNGQFFMQV